MFGTSKDVNGGRDITRSDVVLCVVGDMVVAVGILITGDVIVVVVVSSSDSIEATTVL